jgi:hypothetical protein
MHELCDEPICQTGKKCNRNPIHVHKVTTTKNPRSPRMDSEPKKVPPAGIDSIRSKLALKIFAEYANILKDMYITRFKTPRFRNLESKDDHNQMCIRWSLVSTHLN